MTLGPQEWQLRVHGVGGPQGPKMLGELNESDVYTLPAVPLGEDRFVPPDPKSRLVRRHDLSGIVAYEWGALTLGSLLRTLWVVFLPFTLLNVAGWSHRRWAGKPASVVTHALAGLGTLTYVGWIGYLFLDLLGRQWRDHMVAGNLPPFIEDVVRCAALPLAYALFVATLAGLWWVNRRSEKEFESFHAGDPVEELGWDRETSVTAENFFRHAGAYKKRRLVHTGIGVAGVGLVVWLSLVPRDVAAAPKAPITSIGVGLLVVAGAQVAVLFGWWMSAPWTKAAPQAIFATLGTLMCHATFAGTALLAIRALSKWPAVDGSPVPLVSGPELGLADHFLYAVVIGVVVGVLVAVVIRLKKPTVAGYPHEPPGLPARLVGLAVPVATVLSLSFLVSLAVFVGTNAGDLDFGSIGKAWASFLDWYEGWTAKPNAARTVGAFVLTGLPLVFVAVLRKPRDGAAARVLGNVWDVLTFWPRRFHPFGVPPYSERAVPELRQAIRDRRREDKPLVVAGHSQGSVLSFAAIGAELAAQPDAGPVAFVTFGSPLGTLYAQAFPAYFGEGERILLAFSLIRRDGEWCNAYRSTDPISGPVVPPSIPTQEEWQDMWIPDPRLEMRTNPAPLPPPLERVRPWKVPNGHNFYLADHEVQAVLQRLGRGA